MGFFRLDRAQHAQLRAIARAQDLPVSAVVRRAIVEFLLRLAA